MKRRFGSAGGIACVAGVCALGAVVAAHATETLTLKTVIPAPGGGKFTSFDISFVDTTLNLYLLGDRTNSAVQVVNTNTNTIVMSAGQGLFTGNTGNNNTSGPDGVMTVLHREIWAGDGDSTLKFLSLANGALLGQVSTGGQFRVDEMCYDSIHNIGFVANNADSPPFITAVSARSHTIIGKINFDNTVQNGGGIGINATNGVEQCVFNPRDNKIYVSVPEIGGPGDNSFPGGVARINPLTLQIEAVVVIPIGACSGPQGLAVGPVASLGGSPQLGQLLTGCNGAVANASGLRPTALIDDGTVSGTFGGTNFLVTFEAGNDMVAFNGIVTASGTTGGDGHYYLARSGNNSPVNPQPMTPSGKVPVCPAVASSTLPGGNYGGDIYVAADTPGAAYAATGSQGFAGPQVIGMVNAFTLEADPDTITGQFNCPPLNPRGNNHSVAADPVHNQIYVPISATSWAAPAVGVCSTGGGVDANGCIAVYVPTGSDP